MKQRFIRVPQCVLAGCIVNDLNETIRCFNGYRKESETFGLRGCLYRSQNLPRTSASAGYSTLNSGLISGYFAPSPLWVGPSDIRFNANASLNYIGRTAVTPENITQWFPSHGSKI